MATRKKVEFKSGRRFLLALDLVREGIADIRAGSLHLTDEQFRSAMMVVKQMEALIDADPEWGVPGG